MNSLQTIFKNCLKSDRNSQRNLYEAYYKYALKIAFRYVKNYEDAMTVTNDSFVKAFKHLNQFEIADNRTVLEMRFMGWLKRIVINTCIDELRKKQQAFSVEEIEDEYFDIPVTGEQADSAIMYKELIGHLKELPPAYNKVFNLYVIDGYNHAEIADLLKITVGTSKSNLHRAKEILQKKVAEFFETKKS
ncbi:MAG: RNA polymerase sigma factor [Sediminibacterium sp.]|nr:RNA polymerase sigma factor [Sediminibacterium sp.]